MRGYPELCPKVTRVADHVGDWTVEVFELSEDDVRIHNLRAAINPSARFNECPPGRYARLVGPHGLVMSTTPMESWTNRAPVRAAKMGCRSFVTTGLGLGCVVEWLLAVPEAERVTVVERERDVIEMIAPYFADDRLRIVHADAFEWKPDDAPYDFAWHDIWQTSCSDAGDDRRRLARRYRAKTRGYWRIAA